MTPTEFANTMTDTARRFDSEPLTAAMQSCYEHAMEGERYMFANQLGPDGEVWPRRRFGSSQHPVLNQTGALMAAATGGGGSVTRIGYRSMEFGVQVGSEGSLAGARVHQYGATIYPRVKKFLSFVIDGVRFFCRKVTIPARPYIGMSIETRDQCRETISEAVLERVFQR
jgi:phage gpG-like protein